jgi:hypothetical protein
LFTCHVVVLPVTVGNAVIIPQTGAIRLEAGRICGHIVVQASQIFHPLIPVLPRKILTQ